MDKLLTAAEKKYFVNLGKYSFSPIMQSTTAISLDYCKLIEKGTENKSPLFFCFPEKKAASLWLSVSILTNNFYADYYDNVIEGIEFKRGDKIKIFDVIAEVERVFDEKIYLKFKDQGGIPINKNLRPQLSKVNSSRKTNKLNLFRKRLKNVKSERNPISKILEPNDSIIINQNNLGSKVLLISGRGYSNKFRKLLNSVEVYDENLSKIFQEDKNIIIKPDLSSFKNYFKSNNAEGIGDFITWIKKLFDITEFDEIKSELQVLLNIIEDSLIISPEFDNKFHSLIDEYRDLEPKLSFLSKKYPGINESLPDNLRAVIINDISQINDFSKTIKKFLDKNIPVIFISNRMIEKVHELEFYNRLFNNNPDYYRLNWNRKKIQTLLQMSLDDEKSFLDNELWEQCKRFLIQEIEIETFEGNKLDNIIPQLQKQIQELDDFENLQKAFYKYFYPALYAIKNSESSNTHVINLIRKFIEHYDEVKDFGIEPAIQEIIENAINIAIEFGENSKNYNYGSNVFSNILMNETDSKLFIPLEMNKISIPSSKNRRVIFTGYPYQEYSGRYLLNASCVDFIPYIKILCWPHEASLTYNYLRRRLKASYFTDNIDFNKLINKKKLLNDKDDFEKEIDSYLLNNSPILEEEEDQENSLNYLHTFKYKGYSHQGEHPNTFKVKCDIINFTDGCFMFLPKGSKVLSEKENHRISNLKFNELIIGSKVFKYKKDRTAFRNISRKNKEIKESFQKLELWKNSLEKVYQSQDENLFYLEKLLNRIKKDFSIVEGNPNRANLQRWIFDDEVISPDNQNLRIILIAADIDNIDVVLKDLHYAYKKVLAYTIRLSSNINKVIKSQLSRQDHNHDSFTVNIEGSSIDVETRTIISIEKSGIEVDYSNTRKILC